jgi:hypothetical protein
MAQGGTMIEWEQKAPDMNRTEIKYGVMVDVSGSMSSELPVARFVANRLQHLCDKLFVISTEEWPWDGGNYVKTTGGTKYGSAFQKAMNEGIRRLVFIGDALDTFDANRLGKNLTEYMLGLDFSIFIVMDANSGHVDHCKEVFQYVYDLNKSKIIKRPNNQR